jgi:hypothetical protein
VVVARIRHDIRQTGIRIAAAQRQARLIESTVLPRVEHAFELARVAYGSGEGPFMDAVESRRLLVTTELGHLPNIAPLLVVGPSATEQRSVSSSRPKLR